MTNKMAAVENNVYDIFENEFYVRTSILPIKSTSGNYCISINMRSCSDNFIMATDEFLQKECYYWAALQYNDVPDLQSGHQIP